MPANFCTRAVEHELPSDEVYRLLLRHLLPEKPDAQKGAVEVLAISPERHDPYSAGFREPRPFEHLALIPGERPYPIVTLSETAESTTQESIVLRIYVGPVEWQGPDDVVIEAGISTLGGPTAHWLWRVGRIDATWRVLRRELVWAG